VGQMVGPAVEKLERLASLGFGFLEPTRLEMDLCERADHVGGLHVAPLVEEHTKRVLEVADRLLGPAEHVRETADVVEEASDGDAVGDLFVARPRALCIGTRKAEVALALGNE